MLLRASLVLLASFSLVAFTGCGDDTTATDTTSAETSDGERVEGSDGSYSIELPGDWAAAEDGTAADVGDAAEGELDDLGVDSSSLSYQDVYYRDPDAAQGTNVNVITEPLPAGVDFETAVNAGLDLIETSLPGAQILSGPDPTTVAGDDAFAISYEAAPAGATLQFQLVQILHEDSVYSVTLTTAPGDEDAAGAEFEEIMDSWSWE